MINGILDRSAKEKNPTKTSANLSEQTEKVLATLAPREEMILRMRFGIGQRASSFEDLARQFSLTRERIRQIELEALRKMRERTRSLYSRASFATFSTSEP
jgi:RNA polymerase primary sigma factor